MDSAVSHPRPTPSAARKAPMIQELSHPRSFSILVELLPFCLSCFPLSSQRTRTEPGDTVEWSLPDGSSFPSPASVSSSGVHSREFIEITYDWTQPRTGPGIVGA